MRIVAALAALAFPVLACECRHISACEIVQLPTVFIGEVIDGGITSIREDPWHSSVNHVRFKVLENFRGLPPGTKTVDVELLPIPGMCAPIPYYSGRRYLVLPSKREGKFFDGACFQGRDVETAADDVRQVREYFSGKRSAHVQGQIAVAKLSSLVDFLLEMGEAKPIGGVTVSTSRNGKTYSTKTSVDGRYTLNLPSGGTYSLRALLEPYTAEPAEISISGSGCAVQDFGLAIDNTISGRVFDERGQPMQDARVGLIDLDRPGSGSNNHAWFNDAYIEPPDMNFTFKNVPIGRYLLVFNPDGPGSGRASDSPNESAYYPLSSSRPNAQIIEIRSGGVHLKGKDLATGSRVEFRQVIVRVRFPDGKPMKTALIRCVGSPLKDGDLPWITFGYTMEPEDGSVHFSAPVNRKLQIEVTDMHGRDLRKIYRSTHEPGTATISQEFVVTP